MLVVVGTIGPAAGKAVIRPPRPPEPAGNMPLVVGSVRQRAQPADSQIPHIEQLDIPTRPVKNPSGVFEGCRVDHKAIRCRQPIKLDGNLASSATGGFKDEIESDNFVSRSKQMDRFAVPSAIENNSVAFPCSQFLLSDLVFAGIRPDRGNRTGSGQKLGPMRVYLGLVC